MDYHLLNFRRTHSLHQYNISFPDGNESGKCTVVQVTTNLQKYMERWRLWLYCCSLVAQIGHEAARNSRIVTGSTAVLLLFPAHFTWYTLFPHTSKLENPKHWTLPWFHYFIYIYFDQDNLNSLAVFCTKPLLNNSFKKAGTPTHTLLMYDVQNNSSQLSSLRTSSTLIHNAKISHKDFCSLSGGWNSFGHSRVKTRLRLLALQSACHAAEKASPSSTACG